MNPFTIRESPRHRNAASAAACISHRILYSDDEITNIRLSWINSCIHVLHIKNLHGCIKIASTYKLLLQNLRIYDNIELYELARADILAILEKIENRIGNIIWSRENIFEKIARLLGCSSATEDDFHYGDTFPDNLDQHMDKIARFGEKIVVDLIYYFNMERTMY